MLLWTRQPTKLYEEILRTGKYTFDKTKEPMRNDYEQAYLWLEEQMKSVGIVRKNPDDPLVWAWHTYACEHICPPLDNVDVWTYPRDEVMLEVEVPDDQVMLSDFDKWHDVLNNWYCNSGLNEDDFDREMDWFELLPLKKQEVVKKESWKRIFDTTRFYNGWASNGYYVQATFFGLTKDQIRRVYRKPITLRGENDE